MKQLTIVLVVAAMCLVIGCEKRAGQSEEADRYDVEIDGPVCILTVGADENLLSDQKTLSRQAKLSKASVESEAKSADEDAGGGDTTPAPARSPVANPKSEHGRNNRRPR